MAETRSKSVIGVKNKVFDRFVFTVNNTVVKMGRQYCERLVTEEIG